MYLAFLSYVLIGLFLILLYLTCRIALFVPKYEKEAKEKLPTNPKQLKLLYETFNNEIYRRMDATTITGSIFITASFLVMIESSRSKEPMSYLFAVASLLIYSSWLLFYEYSSRRLDEICYSKVKAIEEQFEKMISEASKKEVDFKVHRYVEEMAKGSWLILRRYTWFALFILLYFSGLVMLLLK